MTVVRVLVTGGSGFIGSHLVRHLLSRGLEVVNYDALTYAANPASLADCEAQYGVRSALAIPPYLFMKGDVCDKTSLMNVIEATQPSFIFHLAAESHVDRSIHGGAAAFMRTNVMGTHTLLEVLRYYHEDGLSIPALLVSTDEVYGQLELDEARRFTEVSRFDPRSPYAASKASAELIWKAYQQTYQLPLMVSRCSNNYGPYQHTEKMIPTIITHALANTSIPMYGDGQYVRDWIHVQDHVTALVKLMHYEEPGAVYNIGADNELANIDLAKMILDHLDRPYSLISYVKDRPNHDRRYAIDSTKIKDRTGWTPAIDFPTGLLETIAWYRDHPTWRTQCSAPVRF